MTSTGEGMRSNLDDVFVEKCNGETEGQRNENGNGEGEVAGRDSEVIDCVSEEYSGAVIEFPSITTKRGSVSGNRRTRGEVRGR